MYAIPLNQAYDLALTLMQAYEERDEVSDAQVCIERVGSRFVCTDTVETVDTVIILTK